MTDHYNDAPSPEDDEILVTKTLKHFSALAVLAEDAIPATLLIMS